MIVVGRRFFGLKAIKIYPLAILSCAFFVLSLLNHSKNSSQLLYESEMTLIKITIVLKIFQRDTFVIAFRVDQKTLNISFNKLNSFNSK